MSTPKKSIAVIGAGPAGLCALKQLSDSSDRFSIVGFERADGIGGQWLYTEKTGTDENGLLVFSSMYHDLETNLPLCLMEIPDFPHCDERSYVDRQYIYRYLQGYSDTYDLKKHVKFNTIVNKVRPLSNTKDTQWEVTYCDVKHLKEHKTETFDAVLVCTGRSFLAPVLGVPHSWALQLESRLTCEKSKLQTPFNTIYSRGQRIKLFQGSILHSHDYRHSTNFEGKNVVILGAALSGRDISVQISQLAKKVFLSNINDPLLSKMPSNVFEKPRVKRMTKNSVIFEDDTEERVDALMYCTGYLYHMGFLDGVVTVERQHVMPIFKHLVHIEHQTLFIVGIPREVPYFPFNHEEAKFAVRCLLGLVDLPSKEQMYEDEKNYQEHIKQLGMKPQYAHNMLFHNLMWEYNKDISKLGGFEPLPPVMQKVHLTMLKRILQEFLHFREYTYKVTGPDSFDDQRQEK